MSDGTDFVNYELYSNSSRSAVWGTGLTAYTLAAAVTSDAAIDYTVYGKVPHGQDKPAGSYADTVGITVNF
jgi:spore coat protein U-like protein